MAGIRVPARVDFALLCSVQTGFGANQVSLTIGRWGSFPGCCVKWSIQLHLQPRSRMTKLFLHSRILWHIHPLLVNEHSIYFSMDTARHPVEFTVSQELLWLRHGDSSWTQRKGNVRRWKPLPEAWWRDSRLRRLSTCCSEKYSVKCSDSARVNHNCEL
jgi:hypothetical protein